MAGQTTRRLAIVDSLVQELKALDGSIGYGTDLAGNVHPRLLFWDEVKEYPAVHVTAGQEVRQYQGGGYKDRFLSVTLRCYVKAEDSVAALETLLADIETIIDNNGRLAYQDQLGATGTTHDILISSIDTDEGVLSPLGVGEILLQVKY